MSQILRLLFVLFPRIHSKMKNGGNSCRYRFYIQNALLRIRPVPSERNIDRHFTDDFRAAASCLALQHDPASASSASGGGWICELRNKDTGRVRRLSIIEFVTVATAGAPRVIGSGSVPLPRERLRDRDSGQPLPWDDFDARAAANCDWFLCSGAGIPNSATSTVTDQFAGHTTVAAAAAAVDSPRSGTDSPRPGVGGGGMRRSGSGIGSSAAVRRPPSLGGAGKAGSAGKVGRKPSFGAGGAGGGSSGKRKREVRCGRDFARPLHFGLSCAVYSIYRPPPAYPTAISCSGIHCRTTPVPEI